MIAKKLVLKMLEKIESGFVELVCPEATYSFGNPGASLKAILAVQNARFFHRDFANGASARMAFHVFRISRVEHLVEVVVNKVEHMIVWS